jgi:hypothetical protein
MSYPAGLRFFLCFHAILHDAAVRYWVDVVLSTLEFLDHVGARDE